MVTLRKAMWASGAGVTISLYGIAIYQLLFGSPGLALVYGGTGVLFASSMAMIYYKLMGGGDD